MLPENEDATAVSLTGSVMLGGVRASNSAPVVVVGAGIVGA